MKALLFVLFLIGCARNEAKMNVHSGARVSQQGKNITEGQAPKKVEMKPRKKQVLITVGGCGDDCGDAEHGIFRFLEACTNNDIGKAQKFVDTTELKLFGEEEGEKLRELASLGMSASWREEVGKVTKMICGMFEGVSVTERNMVLASGIRKTSLRAEEARFEVVVQGKRFVFVLRPRGLEWLVSEIEKGGE